MSIRIGDDFELEIGGYQELIKIWYCRGTPWMDDFIRKAIFLSTDAGFASSRCGACQCCRVGDGAGITWDGARVAFDAWGWNLL